MNMLQFPINSHGDWGKLYIFQSSRNGEAFSTSTSARDVGIIENEFCRQLGFHVIHFGP